MTARQRMSHRKPPPLDSEDSDRAVRLLSVAVDAAAQVRLLLRRNDQAADLLDEVTRLLELTQVQAAAEAEVAGEAS